LDITSMTAVELGKSIKEGKLSVSEVVSAFLRRMDMVEKDVRGFVTIDREGALLRAKEVQKLIDEGKLKGPLAGVPVAVKDNLCTKGLRTTCGSKILEDFKPAFTAEAVRNLEKAGAVIIGKTNMDEFAMGSTTETSFFGAARNPWNLEHVPGGSSGGSCAAVAACECPFALGTDTGGSIRQPSSFCGVVGLKPTYGTVSRYGLIAYGSSLDQIGPIAKDVTDCAAALEVLASYDSKDSTSIDRSRVSAFSAGPDRGVSLEEESGLSLSEGHALDGGEGYDFMSALVNDVRGMRIGIPRDYFGDGLDREVKERILAAVKALKDRGALVEEFDLSLVRYAIPAYYVIASAEASSNLSRFDGVKYGYRAGEYEGLHNMYKRTRQEGFGAEVKRRIMLGSFVLSSGYYDAYYLKALKVKALIKEAFDRAFARFDVIIAPAAPTTAPKLGESLRDPIKMYLGDIYTVSVNLAGLPGISVPVGTDSKGLPVGMQFIGNCFEENKIIRAAFSLEQTLADMGVKGGKALWPEGMIR
jgi:aspartyl-tRNA(Asn)/glutamyl-tRNA(Gln) amidotransferase subunit A